MTNVRYGLHYMFSDDNLFEDNVFENGAAGSAIMYSERIVFRRNRFLRNRGFASVGLLLQQCDDVLAESNLIADNARGIFLEGTNRTHFVGNIVAKSDIAIVAFASAVATRFEGNSFVGNMSPLMLVGKQLDATFDGNYWSGHREPDLDGDGRTDRPYRLVSVFDHLRGNLTAADLYVDGFAATALGMAETAFPVLAPASVSEPSPLARPPALPDVPLPDDAGNGRSTGGMAVSAVALLAGAAGLRRGRRGSWAPGRRARMIRFHGFTQALRHAGGGVRPDVHRRGWRGGGAARAERLGQDDVTQGRRRPRAADERRGAHRRSAAARHRARRAAGLFVPAPEGGVPGLTERSRGGRVLPCVPRRAARTLGRVPEVRVTERRLRAGVGTYSGGMVQRLGLAVAMLADAPALLLDEPTAALDPEGLSAFYGLVERRRAEGKTVFFTSHQLGDAERLADRFAVLIEGRLVASFGQRELARAARGPRHDAGARVALSRAPRRGLAAALAGRRVAGRCP